MTLPYGLFSELDFVDEMINAINFQIAVTGGNANLTAWHAYYVAQQTAIIDHLPGLGASGFISGSLSVGEIPYATGTDSVASSSNLTWDHTTDTLSHTGPFLQDGEFALASGSPFYIANGVLSMSSGVGTDVNRFFFYCNNVSGELQMGMGDVTAAHQWSWGSAPGGLNFNTDYGMHFAYNGVTVLSLNADGSVTIAADAAIGGNVDIADNAFIICGGVDMLQFNSATGVYLPATSQLFCDGQVTLGSSGANINFDSVPEVQGGSEPILSGGSDLHDFSGAVTIAAPTNAPTGCTKWVWVPYDNNGVTIYFQAASP